MKRLLAIAVAITAITMMTETNANAQGFANGYQFGVGINSNCGGLGFSRFQREQLPYFAQHPPVYYSNIVKRPYGVSPYAAPAGIQPVEMNYAPAKLTVKNPFFKRDASPAKAPVKANKKVENKVTMSVITNPYVTRVATK